MTRTSGFIVICAVLLAAMIAIHIAHALMRRPPPRVSRRQRRRYRSLFDHLSDAVYSLDPKGRYTAANPSALELLGRCEADIGELTYESLIAPADLEAARRLFREAMEGAPQNRDMECIRGDGTRFRANMTNLPIFKGRRVIGVYGIIRDVSAPHEAQLEYMARHDTLTGLPNRISLTQYGNAAIARVGHNHGVVAVLFIDLDHFKAINDSLGHAMGDELLKRMAARLKGCLHAGGILARLGGDEFVIMLEGLACPEDAISTADAVRHACTEPFELAEHKLFVSCGTGISCYPRDGDSIEALMKNAAVAMYHSKKYRPNSYRYFTAGMTTAAAEILRLKNDLHQALGMRAFSLCYQPLFDLRRGRVVGAEALLRWEHPELGMIMPDRFIPLAEQTGLIVPIGEWAMEHACREAVRWRELGLGDLRVSVNLSAPQLMEGELVRSVEAALSASGLPPRLLELEITESAMMHDPVRARDTLYDLHAIGVSVAVDDFGTGYSSLNYLKLFPLDSLKIDKSFIDSVPTSKDDVAIAQSIIALARSLGLRIIAEGVEKPAQLEFVKAEGCDEAQGYLFGPPQAADVFLEALRSANGAHGGEAARRLG